MLRAITNTICKCRSLLIFIFFMSGNVSAITWSECDFTIENNQNWYVTLHNTIAAASSQIGKKYICFKDGNYTITNGDFIEVNNSYNIIFTSPGKKTTIIGSVNSLLDKNLNTMHPIAVLNINYSHNIYIENISIINNFSHPLTESQIYSTTLSTTYSRNINILESKIKSYGKSTISTFDSTLNLANSMIECYYFCITAGYDSKIISDKANYILNYTKIPNATQIHDDTHAAFYTDESDLIFNGGSVEFITGNGGFVMGKNTPNNHIVLNELAIINPQTMKAWIPLHENYRNLIIEATGNYPDLIKKYFCAQWDSISCPTGFERGDIPNGYDGSNIQIRLTNNQQFTNFPLPPEISTKFAVVNGSGQYGGVAEATKAIEIPWLKFSKSNLRGPSISWGEVSTATATIGANAYAAWMDPTDYAAYGVFNSTNNIQQLLTINTSPTGAAIALSEIDFSLKSVKFPFWKYWSTMPSNWLQNYRQIITGNFTNTNKSQILVLKDIKTSNDLLKVYELSGNDQLNQVVSTNKTTTHSNMLGGWMDANDYIVSGDFLRRIYDQVLFLNSSGTGGMLQIIDISSSGTTTPLVWQNWSDLAPSTDKNTLIEWLQSGKSKVVAGDFLGNIYEQIAVISPSGIIFLQMDPIRHKFNIVYKVDSASESFPFADYIETNKTHFKESIKIISTKQK